MGHGELLGRFTNTQLPPEVASRSQWGWSLAAGCSPVPLGYDRWEQVDLRSLPGVHLSSLGFSRAWLHWDPTGGGGLEVVGVHGSCISAMGPLLNSRVWLGCEGWRGARTSS